MMNHESYQVNLLLLCICRLADRLLNVLLF